MSNTKNISNICQKMPLFNRKCVLLILIFSFVSLSIAQKNAARYEIDAKRVGLEVTGKEALPRSKEFIRLDSTYYVGYLIEGIYKYERSSDYLGYQLAVKPLAKALYLFEKDFSLNMKNLFSSTQYFVQNNRYFSDFYSIVSTLQYCYNNLEMPDSSMALIQRIENYQFQRDFFSTGADKAWLYHRNRFYTSKKFSFLKNSITENEKMAFACCYEQIAKIYKNKAVNDYWYGPYQSNDDLMMVYHNLAIIHNYNKNYDSTAYYQQLLMQGGRLSWNNYANDQQELGNFDIATENYAKQEYYGRNFQLSEPHYYLPTMYIYAGKTKEAINLAQAKITQSGSTPGFGWYNIALSRAYLYDGQLDSADFYLDKAANFKELHIGTTLTQSQYDFTINLLRLQLIDKKSALIKFLNDGWWYSADLIDVFSLFVQKTMLEYALVNELSGNLERERLIYELFCSESTVTFDESWFLMKEFSKNYFNTKYQTYIASDKREKIIRYFKLYNIKFLEELGDESESNKLAKQLISETITGEETSNPNLIVNLEYEKLFIYRLLESAAKTSETNEALVNKCYDAYPQLLPFSGLTTKLNLTITGVNDNVIDKIKDDIEDCNFEIATDINLPQVNINFIKKGSAYLATVTVKNYSTDIETVSTLVFNDSKNVAKELVLRLFQKGGAGKI